VVNPPRLLRIKIGSRSELQMLKMRIGHPSPRSGRRCIANTGSILIGVVFDRECDSHPSIVICRNGQIDRIQPICQIVGQREVLMQLAIDFRVFVRSRADRNASDLSALQTLMSAWV
jgi:hypothetical protein